MEQKIKSKINSSEYDANYERIFKNSKESYNTENMKYKMTFRVEGEEELRAIHGR